MLEKRRSRLILSALLAYYLYFAIPALRAKFAVDDPMNLQHYWTRGFPRTLFDSIAIWSSAYRPVGGLLYLPVYYAFGLDALPYRIAILTVLGAGLYFAFRFVEMLSKSTAAAALAVLLLCAHPSIMVGNFYNTSYLYDDLAFFFTAAMLYSYVRFREDRTDWTTARGALIVLLYVAAIGSKETAIAGAAWVLAYELICRRPRAWRMAAILAVITAVFTAGRVFGPGALSRMPGYQLEISPGRYLANHLVYLNDVFCTRFFDAGWKLALVAVALIAVGAAARRRELWWCLAAIALGTLPTAFPVNPRGGASLAVPLIAWAAAAGVLVATIPRPALRCSVVIAAGVMWTAFLLPRWRISAPGFMESQRLTWSVISQCRGLPRPAPHSRVIFLDDPFDTWDTYMIAQLAWGDPTLDIKLGKRIAPPIDLSAYDWVLAFEGETVRIVRGR